MDRKEHAVFDFNTDSDVESWIVVNDGVMGGVSQGELVSTKDGAALFRGNLSLDNSGGFASVRTYLPDRLPAPCHGLSVRVRGDGRRYRLRARTDTRFDGVAYQSAFATEPGSWITVRLPIRDFQPTYRGRVLHGEPGLDPGRIRQIGFMTADRLAGPFELEIDWAKSYSDHQERKK